MKKKKTQIKPPSRIWYLVQPLFVVELLLFVLSLPFVILRSRRGGGQPVLVIPGFLAGDGYMWPLKKVLELKGYQSYGWGLGLNKGYRKDFQKRLEKILESISKNNNGQKVILIGYSLGGIYARLVSLSKPNLTKRVITLSTPFMDLKNSINIQGIYRFFSGKNLQDQVEYENAEKIRKELPVPNTTFFSYFDGIVALESCIEPEDYNTDNIEVTSTHLGMPYNPTVIRMILETLSRKSAK